MFVLTDQSYVHFTQGAFGSLFFSHFYFGLRNVYFCRVFERYAESILQLSSGVFEKIIIKMDFKLVFHHVTLGYYLGIIMCVDKRSEVILSFRPQEKMKMQKSSSKIDSQNVFPWGVIHYSTCEMKAQWDEQLGSVEVNLFSLKECKQIHCTLFCSLFGN